MRKAIKSYLAFTSPLYKIVMFLVEPLFFWGVSLYCAVRYEAGGGLVWGIELMLMNFLLYYEILSDYCLFGGICVKGKSRLEYLKTALGGNRMLRDGIVVNFLRRFVMVMGTFAIWTCVGGDWGNLQTGMVLYFIITNLQTGLAFFFIVTLGVVIGRFLDGMYLQLLIAWMASGLLAFIIFGAEILDHRLTEWFGPEVWPVIPALLLVISVAMSCGEVAIVMNKMKGSYRDEKY